MLVEFKQAIVDEFYLLLHVDEPKAFLLLQEVSGFLIFIVLPLRKQIQCC